MNGYKIFLACFLMGFSIAAQASSIHCPPVKTIHATLSGDTIYTGGDASFEPWIGEAKTKTHNIIQFDRVNFSFYNDAYHFDGCYYSVDGVQLKMKPFDGHNVSRYFALPENTKYFNKTADSAICTAGELLCAFEDWPLP